MAERFLISFALSMAAFLSLLLLPVVRGSSAEETAADWGLLPADFVEVGFCCCFLESSFFCFLLSFCSMSNLQIKKLEVTLVNKNPLSWQENSFENKIFLLDFSYFKEWQWHFLYEFWIYVRAIMTTFQNLCIQLRGFPNCGVWHQVYFTV